MNTCKECIHAEMCKWIDELEGRGCDFFDGEQEPCEDAISRHKAIVMITAYEGKSAQIEALEQLPSVQPSRKGHWIKESPFMLSECSECGNKAFGYHGFDETRTDFCPNCGADMRGKENNV